MHSAKQPLQHFLYDGQASEAYYPISLADGSQLLEMDFTSNPNILIEIAELRDAKGQDSPIQAGLLVNHDHSCWLTNLGRNGSTEVYRPHNGQHRKLAFNQVAYLRHGDCVGFYGSFFRVLFGYSKIQLKPLSSEEISQLGH
jgi:hypothetical protein